MSVQLERTRRIREVNGPTPHSVGIFARPTLRRPKEHLVLERRRQDELRDESLLQVSSQKQFEMKTTWEQQTDKMIQRNKVKRIVGELQRQQEFTLEERREHLRQLLWLEEDTWFREMEQKQETVEDRQEAMKEKLSKLKAVRAKEKQEFIVAKLDQQFRNNCEEVRSVMAKRNTDQISRDRNEQLRYQEALLIKHQQEDQFYADIWQKDIEAKAQREENEVIMLIERNKETLRILYIQTAALEKQREEAKRLREEEAEHLKEQSKLRAFEEERRLEDKRCKQREIRNTLDYSLKLKLKRHAKETQEELALDMKILEDLLQATKNEAQETLARKRQRMNEMYHYRKYLEEQKIIEIQREKELDELISTEVEKQWQVRIEKWRKEKQARNKLMKDVLEARKIQLAEKIEKNREEQEELQLEQESIMENIREHKILEEQQKDAILKANRKYRQDLQSQMKFQEKIKEEEKKRELMEFVHGINTEKEYKDKVNRVLSGNVIGKRHPRRSIHSTQ